MPSNSLNPGSFSSGSNRASFEDFFSKPGSNAWDSANSTQITNLPNVKSVNSDGSNLLVNWTGSALQATSMIGGVWLTVATTPGVYLVPITSGQFYFRAI